MERLLRVLRQRDPDTPEKELYARIVCGQIYVNGERVRDPAAAVERGAAIEYRRRRYVSRGGDKLHAALAEWRIPVAGKVFLDAGASSGGFTDCLLQFGAACVHAVDVGYNQLDFGLRSDPRVVVHERTNLMTLPALDPPADAAVADLSFRSLHGAAGKLLSLAADGWAIVLVKPQFELAAGLRHRRTPPRSAGSARDTEGGVVRDRGVLLQTLLHLAGQLHGDRIAVQRVLPSPIAGRRGNREFLFLIASAGVDPPGCRPAAVAAEAEIRRAVAQLDHPAGLRSQPNDERSSGSPM